MITSGRLQAHVLIAGWVPVVQVMQPHLVLLLAPEVLPRGEGAERLVDQPHRVAQREGGGTDTSLLLCFFDQSISNQSVSTSYANTSSGGSDKPVSTRISFFNGRGRTIREEELPIRGPFLSRLPFLSSYLLLLATTRSLHHVQPPLTIFIS